MIDAGGNEHVNPRWAKLVYGDSELGPFDKKSGRYARLAIEVP